jgi:DNA polymerase III epsilon subunit-like protein
MKVLVFDTETTGLPKEKNASIYDSSMWPHIIQLSYIVYDSDANDLVELVDDYINIALNVNIDSESEKIHKISREMLKNGVSISVALKKFNSHADKCDLLVAHNVSFDKRMLMVEGIRNKIHMNINDTYCTMKNSVDLCKIEAISRTGEKYFKYPKLSELHYELFKKNPKNTHNALIDILICLRCFCKMELKKDISRINRPIRLMLRDTY